MSRYKMIAFDMDGTLLDTQKRISRRTKAALEKAGACGKEVVICTGRSLAEMQDYLVQLPQVRWMVCASGSYVYDLREKRTIAAHLIPVPVLLQVLMAVRAEQPLVVFETEQTIIQRSHLVLMSAYGMGVYQPLYVRIATQVDDIYNFYKEDPFPAGKMNLFHSSAQSRARSRKQLAGLDLELVDASAGTLECTQKGVTKAMGMKTLCQYLKVAQEDVIAVGDSYNDMEFLQYAGLGAAMGNAYDAVKAVSDVTVSDCDHDGCAEVIEKYLL